MNTEQLWFLCKNIPDLRDKFLGVFPSDKLPHRKKFKEKKFYIANIDPSYKDGSHWVTVIFTPGKEKDIYFDSYGLPPHEIFTKNMKDNYAFNKIQLQHPLSTACGQWCIFFLCCYFTNHSLRQIKKFFRKNSDLFKNDVLVNKFVNDLFSFDEIYPVVDKGFLKNQFSIQMKNVV